ncbi:beta-CASP ribonuclease aCPSF1 [Candidatus Woesearchaeota archaeon]|nr:beta-CASP ribonuclease aCPSF1 [Candidatus Woesearchaeota archaeon]
MANNGNILKEIIAKLPEGKISDMGFEGANIVLYTKDRDFFLNNNGTIRDVVSEFKKRIELRPDPAILMDMQEAEKFIKGLLPEEANIGNIIFEPFQSIVIIEAEKPGVAIGKQGSNLRDIKEKTLWVPTIQRTPSIRSELLENINSVLYANSDFRRKFLHKTGERIYNGWIRGKKNEWVRVTFLGAGRQVGRSSILLQTPESRILLDCGIDPGVSNDSSDAYPMLEAPEFKIEDLDAVVISHAHLDHTGFLPWLFKYGYRGPVYCTAPTRDVMSLLQLDFVKIMRMNGQDPIYTSDDIKEMVKHTITLNFGEVTDVTPDVRLTMHNSGHILGSAMVHLHIGNGLHNMLYTADYKFGKTTLLDPADFKFTRMETMITEATYGGKDAITESKEESEHKFSEFVNDTLRRGGKVLLPVLGVGRAQEMLLIIEQMHRNGILPDDVKVFIDGSVWDVTAIHTAYPEYMNANVRKMIFHKNQNPFLSNIFTQVGSAKERKEVIETAGPCIVLATSGMLVGGSSVEYFKNFANDAKSTLIFTCYQAAGSLGRRLQRGEREIIFPIGKKNEVVEVKMQIETIEGFSGHSDRKQLMSYMSKVSPKPARVIMNHGESSRCLDLASSIHKQFRVETIVPKNLESIRLV